VSDPVAEETPCRNCERPRATARLDAFGWCEKCRAVVIRRATLAARTVAALGLALGAYWVFASVEPSPPFLILWILLLIAIYTVLYKVVQRVAFEVFRSRGVPPPES
jgi:hypothetical protein